VAHPGDMNRRAGGGRRDVDAVSMTTSKTVDRYDVSGAETVASAAKLTTNGGIVVRHTNTHPTRGSFDEPLVSLSPTLSPEAGGEQAAPSCP
jgi:hypothetical protein